VIFNQNRLVNPNGAEIFLLSWLANRSLTEHGPGFRTRFKNPLPRFPVMMAQNTTNFWPVYFGVYYSSISHRRSVYLSLRLKSKIGLRLTFQSKPAKYKVTPLRRRKVGLKLNLMSSIRSQTDSTAINSLC